MADSLKMSGVFHNEKKRNQTEKIKNFYCPVCKAFFVLYKNSPKLFFFLSLDIVLYETNLSVLFLFDKYE